MIKVIFKILFVFSFSNFACIFAFGSNNSPYYSTNKHLHKEREYQHAWCSKHNGIEEFENSDKTRVDCLTETHAIEFDFARKWAESIGQALHYSYMTGKRAKVILILENPKFEMLYFDRVQNLSKIYDFDVEYITPEIIDLK